MYIGNKGALAQQGQNTTGKVCGTFLECPESHHNAHSEM